MCGADTAGLTGTLEGDGPFTVAAPTDAAFEKMDPATLDKISKNPDVLKALLPMQSRLQRYWVHMCELEGR